VLPVAHHGAEHESHGCEPVAPAESRLLAVLSNQEDGLVVLDLGPAAEPSAFVDQLGQQGRRVGRIEPADEFEQPLLTEVASIGRLRLDQTVGVEEDEVVGAEAHAELAVGGRFDHAEGEVSELLIVGVAVVFEESPFSVSGAIPQRPRMPGVAGHEHTRGGPVGRGDSGGESALRAERVEFPVEFADETRLIDVVEVASHDPAERHPGFADRLAVATDVGKQQACDASGGAVGHEVDVAARRAAVRLAVDPCVETGHGDPVVGGRVPAPHLHAPHELGRRLARK